MQSIINRVEAAPDLSDSPDVLPDIIAEHATARNGWLGTIKEACPAATSKHSATTCT